MLGDFHIPHRTGEVPAKYKEILTPNQFAYVLCTGMDVGEKCRKSGKQGGARLDQDIGSTGVRSQGGLLRVELGIPWRKSSIWLSQVVEIKGTKVGLVHGHQVVPWGDEESLNNKAREMDVEILVYGHTHELKFSQLHNTYFVNPGSMTGAFSPLRADVAPSFLILEFKSKSTVIYSYSLMDNNEIKIGDCTITKQWIMYWHWQAYFN